MTKQRVLEALSAELHNASTETNKCEQSLRRVNQSDQTEDKYANLMYAKGKERGVQACMKAIETLRGW